jgi:hypothetical protein
MYQSVMAKRQGIGSSGTGFSFVIAVIKEVLPDKNICLAQDQHTGDQYQVGLNKRGETAWPQVGDQWVLDRSLGHWALRTKITDTQAPKITGTSAGMDADLLQLVGVLSSLGLVQNGLTTGTVPTVTGSRNKMDPAVGTLITILAAKGLLVDNTTAAGALPVITGSRNNMSTTTAAIIDALAARGIITDNTTAATAAVNVWQTPALQNGWVAGSKFDTAQTYNPPIRYRLTGDNHLEFSGWLNSGTSVSFTVLFTVPSAYAPYWDHYISGYRQDGGSGTNSGSVMGIKILGTKGEGASAGQLQIVSGFSTNTTGVNIEILGRVPMD